MWPVNLLTELLGSSDKHMWLLGHAGSRRLALESRNHGSIIGILFYLATHVNFPSSFHVTAGSPVPTNNNTAVSASQIYVQLANTLISCRIFIFSEE
jgi:hypothetical protein